MSIASLLLIIFLGNGTALASPLKLDISVEKYQLPNGLTVLLYEDHSVPLISFQTWFRVGSRYEKPGKTGIAHLFEHMMFKGTPRYGSKEFDRILDSKGAQNNAFTSRDYTGYYIDLPSDQLELVLDMESDRMRNLLITEANLKSEREVVKEERRYRVDNEVMGALQEELHKTVFRSHPYHYPVIGLMTDLDSLTLADCQDFYKRYYAPNNAILVLAGDFSNSRIKESIKKFYGPIPRQELPKLSVKQEPKQTSARLAVFHKSVQAETLSVAFQAPKAGEKDYYALDILANVLGEGTSSRLHRRMVYKDQIATGVGVSNYAYQDPGVFQIITNLKPGVNREAALKVIYGEVWKARNWNIPEKELEKAKTQIMKSYVDSLKTLHGKSQLIAFNETLFGDWKRLLDDLKTYQSLTAEDLKGAAKRYLLPDQRSVIVVSPKAVSKPKPPVKNEASAT